MNRPARFAFRFFALSALGFGLLYLAPMEPVLQALSAVVAWGLRLSGLPVRLEGHQVLLPGNFGIDITAECSGAPHLVLFLAAVWAYPASRRSRLMGTALAGVAVLAGNLVRLLSLFWVGVYAPTHFDFAHTYFWGGLSYAALCALWMFWLRRWGQRGSPPLHPAPATAPLEPPQP